MREMPFRGKSWYDLTPEDLLEAVGNLDERTFKEGEINPYAIINLIKGKSALSDDEKKHLILIVREKAGISAKRVKELR